MRPRRLAAARAAPLALVSVNVGGLRSAAKLQQVLQWARASRFHVIMLQEVGMAAHPLLSQAGAPGAGVSAWEGSAFWSPGTAHSRGCLTLVKAHPAITHLDDPSAPAAALEGRIVRVDCRVAGQAVSLVNVYAPTERGDRTAFVQRLRNVLPADRAVLLGGDLNCVRHAADVVGGGQPGGGSRLHGGEAWAGLMGDLGLVDVWRQQHPQRRDFTHWSASARSGARLDRWLVSTAVAEGWGATSAILPGPAGFSTDHLPVALQLLPPGQMPRGAPLRPPFRRWMLDDDQFKQSVTAVLQAAAAAAGLGPAAASQQGQQAAAQPMAAWLAAKRAVGLVCRQVQRGRRRAWALAERAAADAAAEARAALVASPGAGEAQAAWVAARLAYAQHWRERTGRALQARSVLDHVYGEAGTLYFHRHLAAPQAPSTIATLRGATAGAAGQPEQQLTADLSTDAGLRRAMHIAEQHFVGPERGLFRSRPSDPHAAAVLHAAMPRTLSPSWAAECEGPLKEGAMTAAELRVALRQCARGKAPGLDGLPYEFYAAFWPLVEPLLLAAVNAAFGAGEDPQALAPLLVGLIVLIHKGTGRPLDALVGYRPITLLNCDLKLLAKAVTNRLHLPLGTLVDAVQSAFISGRNISDAVLFYVGLAEHLQRVGSPLWLVLSDLAQAYDSVSWDYLFATLRAMGFREHGHVRWAQLLHRGGRSAVLLNGFASPFMALGGGLAQGSGASPLYWTVVLQPFTAYVNSLAAAGRLHPPQLPGRPGTWHPPMAAPPASHYADDTKAPTIAPDEDGPELKAAFQKLEAASGVGLSVEKTCLAQLVRVQGEPSPAAASPPAGQGGQPGAGAGVHLATGFRLKLPDAPQRLLGVPLSADGEAAAAVAFHNSAGKLVGASSGWDGLQLSFEGRVHVAKQCLASKLVFQAAFLPAPPVQLQSAQRVIRRFVVGSASAEEAEQRGRLMPGEAVLALPKALGGMGYPVLQHAAASLMAKHVAALFGPGWQLWKRLMREALAAADSTAGMPTWAVTLALAPPAERRDLEARLGPRVRAYVQALAAVGPVRGPCHPPGQPSWSFFSALSEPLFHNACITLPDTLRTGGAQQRPTEAATLGAGSRGPLAGLAPRAGIRGAS